MSSNVLTKFLSVFRGSRHGSRRFQHVCNKSRTEARKSTKQQKAMKKQAELDCPNKTCGPPKKKGSFWKLFKTPKEPPPKPDPETCRKQIHERLSKCHPDPDLSEFGGSAYRTCGSAYIVQKDFVEQPVVKVEPEEVIVEKLERHPALKDNVDPMPPFESVEDRMIKLCEYGLHPAYKRYMSFPKKETDLTLPKNLYRSRSGPLADDEYPPHLKLSKECLDRKNIYAEYKRALPPRELLAKMVEMQQNQKPTLERKELKDREKEKMEKQEKC